MSKVKKEFGDKKRFAIECKIDLTNKDYLFSEMSFYFCNNKVFNKHNSFFVLSLALSIVKDFLDLYEEEGVCKESLNKYLTSKSKKIHNSFTELIQKQQYDYLQNLDKDIDIDIKNILYDELDSIYLNFEWEPFIGYMMHLFEYDNNEWILWSQHKNNIFSSCKLEKEEFYIVLKKFYLWGILLVTRL